MSKKLILCLSLFAAMANAAHPEDSRIVYSSSATDQDVSSLISITPKQALPLIFFEDTSGDDFEFPVVLSQAEIKQGRIWSSETEFLTIPPQDQLFFCPKPNDANGKCLEAMNFEEPQPLECEREPTPIIDNHPDPKLKLCGPEGVGTLLVITYKICSSDDEDLPQRERFLSSTHLTYKTKNFYPITLCFNASSNKILFAQYLSVSGKLLSEKLLTREREVDLGDRITESNGHINSDYKKFLDEARKSKPQYEFQSLIPAKFMPFATWRKTTNHIANVALQHGTLLNLWNEVNDYIKTNIIEEFALPRDMTIGLIEIPDDEIHIPKENDKIYNIWVTVVDNVQIKPTRAIAILMNNFIIDRSSSSTQTQIDGKPDSKQYIDKLCGEDLCASSFSKKFTEVGGEVRCCKVTENIAKFFMNRDNFQPTDKVLQIRDITYTV